MVTKFFKYLVHIFCRHQFSWPHCGIHGRDYQVCLLCGTTYEYDWTTMRRTRLLLSDSNPRAEFEIQPR